MARRAMTSERASLKKIGGHLREHEFAALISGEVSADSGQEKKDVIDQQHKWHSVKGGTYWQIFLYRRSRLVSNTILQAIGGVSEALIACIDALPDDRAEYKRNPLPYKLAIQAPMLRLAETLNDDRVRAAFYEKALFNGGEVQYLSVIDFDEIWHVFPSRFVVNYLSNLVISNSKAFCAGQFDAQKVLIKDGVNIGEIELRTDSDQHYREAKFRINGKKLLASLVASANEHTKLDIGKGIMLYDRARRTFKKPIT